MGGNLETKRYKKHISLQKSCKEFKVKTQEEDLGWNITRFCLCLHTKQD